jgi:hypothetical protein
MRAYSGRRRTANHSLSLNHTPHRSTTKIKAGIAALDGEVPRNAVKNERWSRKMKFFNACIQLAAWLFKVSLALFALLFAMQFSRSRPAQKVAYVSASPDVEPERNGRIKQQNQPDQSGPEGFSDVPADHWAYSALTTSGNAAAPDAIMNAAIDKDDLRKVTALLESGASANARNSAAQYAPLVFVKSAAMTRLLVAHGGDVNSEDMVGNTPLNNAANNGLIEVAQTLIAYGANPYARNNSGVTAFDQANGSVHPGQMKQALRSAWRKRAIIERRRD